MVVVRGKVNRTGSQRLSMLRQLHSYPATGRKRAYQMAHISFSQMLHGQDRDGEVRRQGREQLLQRPRSAGRRRQPDDSGLPADLRWLVTRLHSTGSRSDYCWSKNLLAQLGQMATVVFSESVRTIGQFWLPVGTPSPPNSWAAFSTTLGGLRPAGYMTRYCACRSCQTSSYILRPWSRESSGKNSSACASRARSCSAP